MKKYLDIPYATIKGVDPNLTSLDIYAPETNGSWPVLVMIHGGAWVEGDKSNYNNTYYKPPFFTGQGFVYLSINYRLSPAVIHPAHVQDVARALAWVSANIHKYNGDPQRIFLMGHSAGAHLAALVAVDERYLRIHDLGLDVVKGVILLDGAGYDIPKLMKVNDGLQDMYTTAFGENAAAWKDASPISHIAPGKPIPPFLLFTAGARPASFVLSNDLAQALQRAGIRAEVETEPDKNHGTITGDIGRPGDPVTAKIMQFLESLLK
jgi:acetyl esterase/lipase